MLSSMCGLHMCVHGASDFFLELKVWGLQLGGQGTGFCRAGVCLWGLVHSTLSRLTVVFTQSCWTPDYFLQDVAHWQ